MGSGFGAQARFELLEALRERYRASNCRAKGRILDEFVPVAKCHRKHAVRLLGRLGEELAAIATVPGRRVYDGAVREALVVLWEASDRSYGPSTSCGDAPLASCPVGPGVVPQRAGGTRRDLLAWLSVHDAALQRLGGVPAAVRVNNEKTAAVAGSGARDPARSRDTTPPIGETTRGASHSSPRNMRPHLKGCESTERRVRGSR